MPSHPDRVRRNYHNFHIKEIHNAPYDSLDYVAKISRVDIASCMTQDELRTEIVRQLRKGNFYSSGIPKSR